MIRSPGAMRWVDVRSRGEHVAITARHTIRGCIPARYWLGGWEEGAGLSGLGFRVCCMKWRWDAGIR